MRNNILIPEFMLELQFKDRKIICIDKITKKVLDSEELSTPIQYVRKITYNTFLLKERKGETHILKLNFLTEVCKLQTNAEYILDVFLTSPNHGYYFGTYEIGEFSLNNDNKMVLIRSYSLKYCIGGLVSTNENLFLSLRESETLDGPHSYFLVKLNWFNKLDPLILWKKSVTSAILELLLVEDNLYLGLKDGTIQVWNTHNDEYLKTFSLFTAPIDVLIKGKDNIYAASREGELAAISKDGSILWKTKSSEYSIHGLVEDERGINFIDEKGVYFLLDIESGTIKQKEEYKVNPSIHSNLTELRGWLVFSDGTGLLAIHRKYKKIFHLTINDLYPRQLHSLPIGVVTGDDGGFIRWWMIGQLQLEVN